MWYVDKYRLPLTSLICLHAVSSANLMASLWIMATTECYNAWLLLLLRYVYNGIVEFSVRDKQ